MLLPRFLIHLLLKQGCFEDLEPAVFCFPLVKGRARDPVAPADFLSLGPCLVLPQHADDLFFAEAASFHRPSPFFRRRTLPHFGGVFGVQATFKSGSGKWRGASGEILITLFYWDDGSLNIGFLEGQG